MKSVSSLHKREVQPPKESTVAPPPQAPRQPGLAALLSLIPGLGQLYNGEIGKGWLFLGVTTTNLLFCALLIFPTQVVDIVTGLAQFLHVEPKWNLARAAEIAREGTAALVIYAILVGSFVAFAMRDAYDRALRRRAGRRYPRFQLTMPEATSGSFLAHYAVMLVCLIALIFCVTPQSKVEQITDIELVPPAPEPPAQEKKIEPPRPKPPAPKKVEEPRPQPPKPQPPKPAPTPVAVAVPVDHPTTDNVVQAEEPAPAPDPDPAPAAGGGDGSGSPDGGGGGSGAGEVDFGPYLQEMQRRIKRAWFPPKGNESKKIVVKFKIARDGTVSDIRLSRSSGLQLADEAATTAIQNAKLPPLPKGADDHVDIKFTFDYNVFTGMGKN